MGRKKLAIAAVFIAVLIIASVFYAYILVGNNSNTQRTDTLVIRNFSATTYGDKITGATIELSNPTETAFENLTLTFKIDDSEVITPYMRLLMPLAAEAPFANYTVPITTVSIEACQTLTLQALLYDPEQNEPSFPNTVIVAQTYGPHAIAFYLTQNLFGDIINGQIFLTAQEKAYLQITGYSHVEHSNGTWRHIFNSTTNQYQYINDNPNYYQRYYSSKFYPMTENSYNFAYMFNEIGEHYFNVTVCNNSTFTVNRINVNLGGSWNGYALPDILLQPYETYSFPIAVAINHPVEFVPDESFASGDIAV